MWSDKGSSTTSFGTAIHQILEDYFNKKELDVSLVVESIKKTRRSYMQNLNIGEKIAKKKVNQEENYAKPTHLDIRALMKSNIVQIKKYCQGILDEFINLFDELGYSKYEILPEVYVTYSPFGMGGEIDVLMIKDWDKKICRVGDHKIKDKVLHELSSRNELTNELEKKKASENDIIIIQLSYYAYCLHKAGWTVEGGDIFGRNGKWTHYAVDLIPMSDSDLKDMDGVTMEKLLKKYL